MRGAPQRQVQRQGYAKQTPKATGRWVEKERQTWALWSKLKEVPSASAGAPLDFRHQSCLRGS